MFPAAASTEEHHLGGGDLSEGFFPFIFLFLNLIFSLLKWKLPGALSSFPEPFSQ